MKALKSLRACVLIGATLTGSAAADCTCACVEGSYQAICDNAVEPRPMCGPALCAPPPDVREPKPSVAPPGTSYRFVAPANTTIDEPDYLWEAIADDPED